MRALTILGFCFVAGCASAPPPPPAPPAPVAVAPPGQWEMTIADKTEAPPPPAAEAHHTDKPNVATNVKRSLFTIGKKSDR